MCEHLKFPDGTIAIICGVRRKQKYCRCGALGELLCDWKMPDKSTGTCDAAICRRCALEVAPDKHLCRWHQHAWAEWRKRHPNFKPQAPSSGPGAKSDAGA